MRLFDSGYSVMDLVFDEISSTVGMLAPESGGALLGSYSSQLITRFIFDPEAQTTSASYIPSAALTHMVQDVELADDLQFRGVLHSHPGNLDRPSGPDHRSFADGLRANPELGRYLAPIVTFEPGDEDSNKLEIAPEVFMSFYVAFFQVDGPVRVEPCMPRVIWFGRDCRRLATSLRTSAPEFINSPLNDQFLVSSQLTLDDDLDLVLAASSGYPGVPPLALLHDKQSDVTRQLHLEWSISDPPEHRLRKALSREPFERRAGSMVAFGKSGRTLTPNKDVARLLDLDPILVDDEFDSWLRRAEDGLFARSHGVLTDRMSSARVVVAGCGSVGSYAAEQFVRSGVGHITLVDPDTVEFSNLSRSGFTASDVGRQKVNALAQRLVEISPSIEIEVIPSSWQDLSNDRLSTMFGSADLVYCALDDRKAQLQINAWAYGYGVPAIYVGIFAGARAGEIAIARKPGACFSCATQFRRIIPSAAQGEADYGTGRLVAEVALGVDIHSVASIGVRLGLSCLMHDADTSLTAFADQAVDEHSYALFAVDQSFEIVREVIGDAPAQFSHRSIWLTVNREPDCNVCGSDPDSPQVYESPAIASIIAAMGVTKTDPTDDER